MKTPAVILTLILIGCSTSNTSKSQIDFDSIACVENKEDLNLNYKGGCDSLVSYFHNLYSVENPSYFTEWLEPFVIAAEGEFHSGKIQTVNVLTRILPEENQLIIDGILAIENWDLPLENKDIELSYRFYLKKGAIMKPRFIFERKEKNKF
jgi:hypothetical protein